MSYTSGPIGVQGWPDPTGPFGVQGAPGPQGFNMSPYYENRDLLLKASMEKLGITEEDMNKSGFVKEKLREINIDILLS
jgi:hypothetical protein